MAAPLARVPEAAVIRLSHFPMSSANGRPRDCGRDILRAVQLSDPRKGMPCRPLDKNGTWAARLSSLEAGLPPAPLRKTAGWRRGAPTLSDAHGGTGLQSTL